MSTADSDHALDSSDGLLGRIAASGRHLAFLAAATATAGSLFFSEVLSWTPCELCWYQRIAMYPIALLFLIGNWRGDRTASLYALPLAAIGMLISLYHYLMVMMIIPPAACSGAVPCAFDYLNFSGPLFFVKIPFLALVAFLLILFGSIIDLSRGDQPSGGRAARTVTAAIALGVLGLYLGSAALL